MADPIPETTVVPISAALAGALNDGVDTDDEALRACGQDRRRDRPAAARPKGDVEPAPAVAPQPTHVQKEEVPQALALKDVKVGSRDGRRFQITRIYAVQSDEYAIYQAGEVMVHFTDDRGKAQPQRRAMLPVSSARAEVNALVRGLPGGSGRMSLIA